MDLRKVTRGEPYRSPSAAAYNAIVESARGYRDRQGRGRRASGNYLAPGTVLVRNMSGSIVPRFGVLAVNGVVIGPSAGEPSFTSEPCFVGVTPAANARNFVVLQEPLRDGAIGRAVISGLTVARVHVADDANAPRFAEPDASLGTAALLARGGGRAEIAMRAGGTGEQYALVVLGTNARQVFPVTLTQTGGTSGSALAQAAWTYTVTDVDGNELELALNPGSTPHRFRRPAVGVMVAATAGLAHYDSDGAMVIDWCNEVADQEAC